MVSLEGVMQAPCGRDGDTIDGFVEMECYVAHANFLIARKADRRLSKRLTRRRFPPSTSSSWLTDWIATDRKAGERVGARWIVYGLLLDGVL
ncbi:MAG: hypothetical protein A4E19_19330 [Nitrospira sp. SG-bin1]|nr:MAG: hypothetical protein A4E19_19330 [Nitrospira sp. SG-bin1]